MILKVLGILSAVFIGLILTVIVLIILLVLTHIGATP